MANDPTDRTSSRVTPKRGRSGAPVTKAAARKAAAEAEARKARRAEVAANRAAVTRRRPVQPGDEPDPDPDTTATANTARGEPVAKTGGSRARGPAGADKAAAAKGSAGDAKARSAKAGKAGDPKVAARSGNPRRKAESVSSRYTPPIPAAHRVSPWYIPACMFGFLALGMIIIFLNYMQWPLGNPSNWRLLVGLGSILAGILVATRYQ